jgi:hypothetical protein
MQHDIIDNRERKLAASVKPLLSESEKAKFAVGYFFISGFKFIADELEKMSQQHGRSSPMRFTKWKNANSTRSMKRKRNPPRAKAG